MPEMRNIPRDRVRVGGEYFHRDTFSLQARLYILAKSAHGSSGGDRTRGDCFDISMKGEGLRREGLRRLRKTFRGMIFAGKGGRLAGEKWPRATVSSAQQYVNCGVASREIYNIYKRRMHTG